MRTTLILLGIFLMKTSAVLSQVPVDSVRISGKYKIECACMISGMRVLDISSVEQPDKSYRLYFRKAEGQSTKFKKIKPKETLSLNLTVYTYQREFFSKINGNLIQMDSNTTVAILHPRYGEKNRRLLFIEEDLLMDYKFRNRCPKRIAYIF